jgi:cathepsin B
LYRRLGTWNKLNHAFLMGQAGAINVTLSPQYLVSCLGGGGCGVGTTDQAWKFLQSNGIVSEQCYPYTGAKGKCTFTPGHCPSGTGAVTLYKTNSTYLPGAGAAWASPGIAADILTHGPVTASIQVFSDLQGYKQGVYQHSPAAKLLGGHAIKLLGWGVEGGVNYWLAANSWGESWGALGGYFKIRRGMDECGVEDQVEAGLPVVLTK